MVLPDVAVDHQQAGARSGCRRAPPPAISARPSPASRSNSGSAGEGEGEARWRALGR